MHRVVSLVVVVFLFLISTACATIPRVHDLKDMRPSFDQPSDVLKRASNVHMDARPEYQGGLVVTKQKYGVAIFDGADVPTVERVLGDLQSPERDLAAATDDITRRASDLGADVVYAFSPIYGRRSDTVRGWAATAAVRQR